MDKSYFRYYSYYQLQFEEENGWKDLTKMVDYSLPDLKNKTGALTERERIIRRTIIEEKVD